MTIHTAEFVKSSANYKECPETKLPEYAFIGRSNVGKSSLINSLLERKKLAKTSSTPGKTQLINHFLVNDEWYLTDLPGFGYAKVAKTERAKFSKLITNYILKRDSLTNLFMLVDARHDPLANDIDFINFLGTNGVPFSLVFTKKDKLKGKKFEETLEKYQKKLYEFWDELPVMFVTSAETNEGREEVLQYIDEINQQLKTNIIR